MQNFAAAIIVFTGGFIIMVLEIIGARFLAKYFGSSFYIWVSQIGLVLVALSAGYYIGGTLADKWKRLARLAWLLIPAGILICAIPNFDSLLYAITDRHPLDVPVPVFWQKTDPVLGSALVFFIPCVALATLSPYMIRLCTRNIEQVGHASGMIFAASTVGSIGGVFVSGFILIEYVGLSNIFRITGALTIALGILCIVMDQWVPARQRSLSNPASKS